MIEISYISSYHVLTLKSDPTFVNIFEADTRSWMIVEPQLVSDLTRHQNSAIGSCVLLVIQPQSLIFEAIRLDGPN